MPPLTRLSLFSLSLSLFLSLCLSLSSTTKNRASPSSPGRSSAGGSCTRSRLSTTATSARCSPPRRARAPGPPSSRPRCRGRGGRRRAPRCPPRGWAERSAGRRSRWTWRRPTATREAEEGKEGRGGRGWLLPGSRGSFEVFFEETEKKRKREGGTERRRGKREREREREGERGRERRKDKIYRVSATNPEPFSFRL